MTQFSVNRHARERGSALVMALVFTGVVALVVTALLGLTRANLRTTEVVRAHTDQLYAADAGLVQGLEYLSIDPTFCGSSGETQLLPDVDPVNGYDVTLRCQTFEGASLGADGWAVIATATTEDGLQWDGNADVEIHGSVFASRLPSSFNVTLVDGSARELPAGGCSIDNSPGAENSGPFTAISPAPHMYRCEAWPVPDPSPDLPAAPTTYTPPTIEPTESGFCQVFHPGFYDFDRRPVFEEQSVFFRSGTYYFEDVGEIEFKGGGGNADRFFVGGERSDEPVQFPEAGACDDYDDPAPDGAGVRFVLGGDSWMDFDSHAQVELFARADGSEGGTEGVSIQAVTTTSDGYELSSELALLQLINGANPQLLAVHGMVYMPRSDIDIRVANADVRFFGGIVAHSLELEGNTHIEGFDVSATTAGGPRTVLVTASVDGASAGRVDVVAEAVVEVATTGSADILSWRTGRDTTP